MDEEEKKLALADLFMKMADLHLQRVNILQGTEWKVALTFWTAMAFSFGTIMVNIKNLAPLIVEFKCSMAIFQIVVLFCYLVLFCSKNYSSLVTERNSYQHFQNLANDVIKAKSNQIGSRELGVESLKAVSRWQVVRSSIWHFKLASATVLMVAAWIFFTRLADDVITIQ